MADCPFDTFENVAAFRLQRFSGLPRFSLIPVLKIGETYTRLIYGVDLAKASPLEAIRGTSVPVLLIHGSADNHIPSSQSEALHAANPGATELWIVAGAQHVSSILKEEDGYRRRVIAWFAKLGEPSAHEP